MTHSDLAKIDLYQTEQKPNTTMCTYAWEAGLGRNNQKSIEHYCDVVIGAMASQITSLTIVYSTIYSGPDQRKYQSSAPLAFVWGIHRGPVNSPH